VQPREPESNRTHLSRLPGIDCHEMLVRNRVIGEEIAVTGHHLLPANRALLTLAERLVQLPPGRGTTRTKT